MASCCAAWFQKLFAASPRMRRGRVQCLSSGQLHQMAYTDWGELDNPRVLLCVHGLSRNGRDFDTLAAALCGEFRVGCSGLPGRGESGWVM